MTSAAELMATQGFNRCRLEAILAASNVQKGNFYYYFRSKEELALSVLAEEYLPRVEAWFLELLGDGAGGPAAALERFIQRLLTQIADGKDELAPMQRLVAELGTDDKQLSARLTAELSGLAGTLNPRLAPSVGPRDEATPAQFPGIYLLNMLQGWLSWYRLTEDMPALRSGLLTSAAALMGMLTPAA